MKKVYIYDRVGTNDKIRGVYNGVEFTGTVTDCRFHTMIHTARIFYVDLDSPINVFGTERKSISLQVDSNEPYHELNDITEVLERNSNIISF